MPEGDQLFTEATENVGDLEKDIGAGVSALTPELHHLHLTMNNISAGLQTWLDYLIRCLETWDEIQSRITKTQARLAAIQDSVTADMPKDIHEINALIKQLHVRTKNRHSVMTLTTANKGLVLIV